ncbi:O-antigen ligase family protein [Desulfomarina sp.]
MKRISSALFLFTLVFAPLAFGTVEAWSLSVLEISTAAAFLLFYLAAWLHKDSTLKVPGTLPLVLLLGIIGFQLLPLPISVVKILSPETYEVYSPLFQVGHEQNWLPLSVNQRATLHELLRFGSYGLLYVLTVQLLSEPGRLRKTAGVVVFLGSAIALLALIQNVGSPDKIYWLRKVPANASPFGPWINPNQFAGYMELVSPLAFGLFLFYRPRVRGHESFREKFVTFFTIPRIHLYLFLWFAASLMVFSVFVSLCRGGILAIIGGGVTFFLLYRRKFPGRSSYFFLTLAVAVVLAVSWFGWDIILSEFNQKIDSAGHIREGRLLLWQDTLALIRDFPLFGAGFGSFIHIYPLYKTFAGNLIYDHAHNDYLELLTDGGIVSLLLAAWFVISILVHGWEMIRRRRDRYAVFLGIGAISGIISLLVHSMTDFNLHNGAVGYYFFFLLGLLVASVNTRFSYGSSASLLKKQSPGLTVPAVIIGLAWCVFLVIFQVGSYRAWSGYESIENIYVNPHLGRKFLWKIAKTMDKAERQDPFQGLYSYKNGTALWYMGEKEAALEKYILAFRKNPLEGIFLQQLGLLQRDERIAEKLLEEGYRRTLNKDILIASYVEWLLWRGRRLRAIEVLSRSMHDAPGQAVAWIGLLREYSFSHEELEKIIPENSKTWVSFGRHLSSIGLEKEAVYFFDRAEKLLMVEKNPPMESYRNLISFFSRHGFYARALTVLRRAVEKLPDEPYFHLLLGEYYQKENIVYRAKEEFERVLFLDPGNKKAVQALRKLGFADSY